MNNTNVGTRGALGGYTTVKPPSFFARISGFFGNGRKAAASSPTTPRVVVPKVPSSNNSFSKVSNQDLKAVKIKIAALNKFITAVNSDLTLNKFRKTSIVSQLGLIRANILNLQIQLQQSPQGITQRTILQRIESEYADFKEIYRKEDLGRYNPQKR